VAKEIFNEMVIGAVRIFCEFALLVSQHQYSYQSLTALDDTVQRFCQKKAII